MFGPAQQQNAGVFCRKTKLCVFWKQESCFCSVSYNESFYLHSMVFLSAFWTTIFGFDRLTISLIWVAALACVHLCPSVAKNSSMYYFFRSDSTDNKSCPSLCNYDQHVWIFQVFLPPVQHGEHNFRNNFWPNITVCKVNTASANKCHVAYKDRTAWWR